MEKNLLGKEKEIKKLDLLAWFNAAFSVLRMMILLIKNVYPQNLIPGEYLLRLVLTSVTEESNCLLILLPKIGND